VPGLEVVVAGGGLLVDGHDPADHARAVLDLLEDRPRLAAMRSAGLAEAAASSWEHTVDRLLDAYATVRHARMHADQGAAPAAPDALDAVTSVTSGASGSASTAAR